MKYAAIALNVLLLGAAVFLTVKHGVPDDDDLFIVLLIYVVPLVNLLALCMNAGDTFLSLYFKRKALEERKKIEHLQGH